ncbi:hypothetical protein BT93_B1233 [Corymbia citriodora subsp. variegata]|nr:hypothetical protein BT93_B1233 [Corymbia citriodora subsp. variegata]
MTTICLSSAHRIRVILATSNSDPSTHALVHGAESSNNCRFFSILATADRSGPTSSRDTEVWNHGIDPLLEHGVCRTGL